jgi:hypothetical protein
MAFMQLEMKDSFNNDNYSYFENSKLFIVAGRYYLHKLCK